MIIPPRLKGNPHQVRASIQRVRRMAPIPKLKAACSPAVKSRSRGTRRARAA
jgi:hypothetical protein